MFKNPSNLAEFIAGIAILSLVLLALADDYPKFAEVLIKIFIRICILIILATLIFAVLWFAGVVNG